MSGVTVRCLSFHATYRCRHSGDCCTARWPIPIEPEALARARAALSVASGLPEPSHRAHAAGRLPLDTHGCVFHDAEARQCRIHAVLGHDALPLACRQFPRVTVHDPRGVSVALSAYCPTARASRPTYSA